MTERPYTRAAFSQSHRYAPRHPGQRLRIKVQNVPTNPVAEQVQLPTVPQPKRQRQLSVVKPAHPRQSRSLVLKRKGVSIAPPLVNPTVTLSGVHVPKRRRSRMHRVHVHPALVFTGSAVAAAVLVFGGGLLLFRPKDNASDKYSFSSSSASTLGASTSSGLGSNTNEMAPTADQLAAHSVPEDQPRLLKIPKLQLTARVMSMETDTNGLPATPSNLFDVGWFAESAKLGQGVTLINGKAAGQTRSGIFGSLESLNVGDLVYVEQGNGQMFTYKVAKLERHDPEKLDKTTALKPAVAGKPALNLLSANGRYNTKTNKFEDRLLIQAVLQ